MNANINRTLFINSEGSDPAKFEVKVGQLSIPPNSEIAVKKINLENRTVVTVDNTNDSFVLLWGNYDLEKVAAGGNSTRILPPEKFKLKHGDWDSRGEPSQSAGGPLTAPATRQNSKTLLNNLVDTINEQSCYNMFWQWAAKWSSNVEAELFYYLADYENNAIFFDDWAYNLNTKNFTIIPAVPATFPIYTRIQGTGDDDNYGIVSKKRFPLLWSVNTKNAANDFTRDPMSWEFRTGADGIPTSAFGGYVLEEQVEYTKKENYNYKKDWVIVSQTLDGGQPNLQTEQPEPRMSIYWFLQDTGRVCFKVLDFNEDGYPDPSRVLYELVTDQVFDGTVAKRVAIRPTMSQAGGVNKLTLSFRVAGAEKGTFEVPTQFFGKKYRMATWWNSELDLWFLGVDESCSKKNLPADSLGPPARPTAGAANLGTWNATLVFAPVFNQATIDVSGMVSYVNNGFEDFTRNSDAICAIPAREPFIPINGATVDEDNPVTIDFNIVSRYTYGINITNLPLMNNICLKNQNYNQKRLANCFMGDATARLLEINDPTYHTLQNKQPFTLTNLNIEIVDNLGRVHKGLIGTTSIELHLRTNQNALLRELIGAVKSRPAVLESQNSSNVEDAFKLYQKVL